MFFSVDLRLSMIFMKFKIFFSELYHQFSLFLSCIEDLSDCLNNESSKNIANLIKLITQKL